jgi:hypothetical protein
MRPLSQADVLDVWERGRSESPVERPLTILATAFPRTARREIAAWSIALRDERLFVLRRSMFGDAFDCAAVCPACEQHLDLNFDGSVLAVDAVSVVPEVELSLDADGYHVRFRRPNSLDLAAVAGATEIEAASKRLVEGCIVEARCGEGTCAPDELPEGVVGLVADGMAVAIAAADVRVDIVCPACGNGWTVPFDIGTFLWNEITIVARRALDEVHRLAWAYGWAEADILAMSETRRRAYIEMAAG